MTISVVACGNTASEWYKTPCDLSIGVNDVLKFGENPNWLLCINGMNKFTDTRKKLIMDIRPNKFFSHNQNWLNHFSQYCEVEKISMLDWTGKLRKGKLYHTESSPFVATTLAFAQSPDDIIIWGVDFVGHQKFSEGSRDREREIKRFMELCAAIEKQGTRVWIGKEGSALNLPVWQDKKQLE